MRSCGLIAPGIIVSIAFFMLNKHDFVKRRNLDFNKVSILYLTCCSKWDVR